MTINSTRKNKKERCLQFMLIIDPKHKPHSVGQIQWDRWHNEWSSWRWIFWIISLIRERDSRSAIWLHPILCTGGFLSSINLQDLMPEVSIIRCRTVPLLRATFWVIRKKDFETSVPQNEGHSGSSLERNAGSDCLKSSVVSQISPIHISIIIHDCLKSQISN